MSNWILYHITCLKCGAEGEATGYGCTKDKEHFGCGGELVFKEITDAQSP